MTKFVWAMSGTDGNDNGWQTAGELTVENILAFSEVLGLAQIESFRQLTNGKAKYGNPGVGGCKGPYKTNTMAISRVFD